MPKWLYDGCTGEFKGDALYFIRDAGGPIKIGRGQPERRLARLQTGNPNTLSLIGSLPDAGYTEELWHHLFALCRKKGEWFEPRKDLRNAIKVALMGGDWARCVWFDGRGTTEELASALCDAVEIYDDLVFGGMKERCAAEESVAIAVSEFC